MVIHKIIKNIFTKPEEHNGFVDELQKDPWWIAYSFSSFHYCFGILESNSALYGFPFVVQGFISYLSDTVYLGTTSPFLVLDRFTASILGMYHIWLILQDPSYLDLILIASGFFILNKSQEAWKARKKSYLKYHYMWHLVAPTLFLKNAIVNQNSLIHHYIQNGTNVN
jgi:hypothetical protein